MQELHDKVAVVTGAASGIGLGIARSFLAAGMRLVLADIDEERLTDEARVMEQAGAGVLVVPTDVGDPGAVEALADAAFARHGAVHVLVNNAGILASGRTWEIPLSDWHRVLDVNLWGAIHGVRTFVPRMLDQGAPAHILNMGSMASVTPVPGIGPYNVAKHGLLALTEGLASELAAIDADIAVTLVMPGRVGSRLGGGEPDPTVMSADELGEAMVEVLHERPAFYFSHPDRVEAVRQRFARIVGDA
jgi:NAD(P)-dependent dehydrogenase (short-subunit alcohol dehydrogenase family)